MPKKTKKPTKRAPKGQQDEAVEPSASADSADAAKAALAKSAATADEAVEPVSEPIVLPVVEPAVIPVIEYIEFAPGQFLFTQEWEQQSFDCQSRLLKEGKPSTRRMLDSARYALSQVNGAVPTADDSGKVWPHIILIELN